jgi:hypothetical protein
MPTFWLLSIQLVSPASGKPSSVSYLQQSIEEAFHSISFPSEWEEFVAETISRTGFSRQIDAPLKYSTGKREKAANYKPQTQSLQSIDAS